MQPATTNQSSVTVYKPGERVRQKGIYRVFHHAHRTPHEAAIVLLEMFPECNQCGDRVRFQLVKKSGELLRDYNFAKPRKPKLEVAPAPETSELTT